MTFKIFSFDSVIVNKNKHNDGCLAFYVVIFEHMGLISLLSTLLVYQKKVNQSTGVCGSDFFWAKVGLFFGVL